MHLRNASHFRLALSTAMLLAAASTSEELELEVDAALSRRDGPSASTLSRSKYRLDLLAMLLRRCSPIIAIALCFSEVSC